LIECRLFERLLTAGLSTLLRDTGKQARADLGIVTTRANTGGVQAVQWRLPD